MQNFIDTKKFCIIHSFHHETWECPICMTEHFERVAKRIEAKEKEKKNES